MEFKVKMIKLRKLLLSIFICLTTIIGTDNLLVKAITYNLTEEFKPEWQHAGTTAYGDATKMWVNGDLVWCLQPDNRTLVGNQTVIDASDIGLTQTQMNKIALIVYYGYRNKTHNDINYFLTQNMIWKYLGESGRLVSNSYPNDSSWKSIYNNVMKEVNNFNKLPSFNNKTYSIDVEKTMIIDDTNNILNELLIKSVKGGKASITGNSLKITPDGSAKNMAILFKRNISMEQTQTNFIVRANGKDSYGRKYQAVSPCVSGNDPYIANVKLNVNLYGSLKIAKQDEGGNAVPNTTFKVSNNADMSDAIGTFTTDANGTVTASELKPGVYYVQEVSVPNPLLIDKTIHKVTIKTNETTSFTAKNKWALGSLRMEKEDSITGKQPQGEATLKGAVYGLYARKAILHPGTKAVVFTKNTLVKKLTTNEDANASVKGLFLGEYFLKEITPSPGYTLDSSEYEIPLTYENQNVAVIVKNQIVKERVKAQSFSLIKISDNGNGESDLLAGVEFTIKAQKDIKTYGSWEKAPIAKNAKGKTAGVLVTDKKGYAVSEELPYGTYIVRETKVPDDYYKVEDFKVVVNEDSREPQPWKVFNDEKFRAVVRIEKRDVETNEIIKLPGAKFKIKNLDKGEYVGNWVWNPFPHYVDSWTTGKDGMVMTDNVLDPGNYQLEEVEAPQGYVLNTKPLKFKISSNGIFETLPDGKTPVIVVQMKDQSVKGKIKLSKEGEMFTGIKKVENGVTFVYEKRNLTGVTFGVYAKEDIYSADKQEKLYAKDSLVEKIKSDKDGIATTKELPLGAYYVKELETLDGYILSDEVHNVNLVYKDQITDIVYKDLGCLTNQRRKVRAEAIKKDDKTKKVVEGAEISIYANRDVYNVDGKVVMKTDDLVKKLVTNQEGNAEFDVDLPIDITPPYATMPISATQQTYKVKGNENALFYMMETKAPAGYQKGDELRCYVDTKLSSMPSENMVFENSFYNEKTRVEIDKKDRTGNYLEGAKLEVLDDKGKRIVSWTSKKESQLIEGLQAKKNYVLHEVMPPLGYTTAKDVPFTLESSEGVYHVAMIDNTTRVDIKKIDKTTKQGLHGNALELYDDKGTLVDTWISTNKAHRIEKLHVNKVYTIKEKAARKGYTIAVDKTFLVKDSDQVQIVTFENTKIVPKIQNDVRTGDSSEKTIKMAFLILSFATLLLLKKRKEKQNT